jgi:hypothetical protein
LTVELHVNETIDVGEGRLLLGGGRFLLFGDLHDQVRSQVRVQLRVFLRLPILNLQD